MLHIKHFLKSTIADPFLNK